MSFQVLNRKDARCLWCSKNLAKPDILHVQTVYTCIGMKWQELTCSGVTIMIIMYSGDVWFPGVHTKRISQM